MSPDSPAGKAAAELARRIRAMGTPDGDPDPDTLATRWMGDFIAQGWRPTEARAVRPELDPLARKPGTPRLHEHAAAIRAELARKGSAS